MSQVSRQSDVGYINGAPLTPGYLLELLSVFLSWVSKTQPHYWTKRMAKQPISHLGPKNLPRSQRFQLTILQLTICDDKSVCLAEWVLLR